VTVVLCGVGADSGNVRPVPRVDDDGRFEYVPIPEKGGTTETATYGSIPQRHGDGSLADALEGIRPGSSGAWVTDPDAIAAQPVHRDPNFDALTYGEHRPGYVDALASLDPGDVVAFYTGFRTSTSSYKHRYCFGYLTVAADPVIVPPDASRDRKRAILADHPANAHAKRFAGHGELYYHDADIVDRLERVVLVSGREPGGLLDRAVRLSDERRGPNYYMAASVANALRPANEGEHGVHLGGFKPAVTCDIDRHGFLAVLDERTTSGNVQD
jgi:hypothetical protein